MERRQVHYGQSAPAVENAQNSNSVFGNGEGDENAPIHRERAQSGYEIWARGASFGKLGEAHTQALDPAYLTVSAHYA